MIAEADKYCSPYEVVYIGNSQAFCQDENTIYSSGHLNTKAHNIFLDDLVSIGIVGLLTKIFLFRTHMNFIKENFTSQAITIVDLIYLLTWFDCAQCSHLAWWFMSAE
ncbi:hypothetical protein DXZ20_02050 [Leptolyngbyaceae cyanobacterium CCMR0081]|uniref:Uncharacterized protein n=1 Tax=Adonisia turfae CCMR0081 TaxID=2292702 RepID=A0A6M0RDZ8_9CYAN|nr:hypothetical protein [Adonisia turfae CCMR0081]